MDYDLQSFGTAVAALTWGVRNYEFAGRKKGAVEKL